MSNGPFYRRSLRRPRGKRRAARYNGRSPRPNRILPRFLRRSLQQSDGITPIGVALRGMAALGLALVLLAVVLAGGAAASAVYSWTQMTKDLPDYEEVESLQFETTKIYDRNGRLLHEVSDPLTGWRTAVSYEEIMENAQENEDEEGAPSEAWILDAMVAAEDSTFWTNPGIDPVAISRSFVTNLTGSATSGASTITQQLVRALFPESIGYEQSYTRKAREAVMAWHFAREFEKEEILEMYLNNVYFGNRSYGIDAAAQAYFNKFAWDLSLGEAAMLAGLPQAPSLYDPTQNFEYAKVRQRYVLDRMVQLDMITPEQADEAYEEPIDPQRREGRHDLAPHFVNYVRYVIEQEYGAEMLFRGGLEVHTTLDYELQLEAERIVREGVQELEPWQVNNGALVAMLPWSGEILAMVGSADYYDDSIHGQVNVTTRERQPGSSIKPVSYLAAMEDGWHPGTMIFDYGKEWETPDAEEEIYAPLNASGQFYGAVSMREALANSLNIPAVQALEHAGVGDMISLAHDMGIRTGLWRGLSHYGLATTLGGGEVSLLEHTNLFATMSNMGTYVPNTPFLRIIGGDGETVFELDRESALDRGEQVVMEEHAYQMTDILSDNDARSMIFGTDSPLAIPELDERPIAAKTGTTDDNRDGWTMGYSTELVTGVWVGNTDNRPTDDLSGVQGAAPIWNEFMQLMHTDEEFNDLLLGPDGERLAEEFPRPDGIVEEEICTTTGKRPIGGTVTTEELLIEDGPPEEECNEITDYEEEELEAAIQDALGNGRFTQQGIISLHSYAEMVGVPSPLIQEEEPEEEFVDPGGGVDDPGGGVQDPGGGQQDSVDSGEGEQQDGAGDGPEPGEQDGGQQQPPEGGGENGGGDGSNGDGQDPPPENDGGQDPPPQESGGQDQPDENAGGQEAPSEGGENEAPSESGENSEN